MTSGRVGNGRVGYLFYDSIACMQYEVMSSPESKGGGALRRRYVWEAHLLEKCNRTDGLAGGSGLVIILSETSLLTWAVECKHST